MKGIIILGLYCLIAVHSAPVEVKEETKRRETTRETLELENELKRLAGEDKQYFTANGGQPMPQIDGLEDHPKHPAVPVRQPVQPVSDVVDEDEDQDDQRQVESEEQQQENMEDEESQDVEPDISNNNNNNEEDERDEHNPNNESEDNEGQNNMGEKDIPSSDEMGLDNEVAAAGPQPIYYPEQGYGNNYINYKGDYPYGGINGDGDLQNEDFVVQDVLEMMEQHPQLWNRLIQAKNDLMKEEEDAEEGETENNGDDDNNSNDQIDNSEPQLENIQQLSNNYYQQPESIYDREEEALQKMKALQQYEKYQHLYGDADAHVVAKKRGYGPVSDNTAKESSGETSENQQAQQREDQGIPEKTKVKNTVDEGKSSSENKIALM